MNTGNLREPVQPRAAAAAAMGGFSIIELMVGMVIAMIIFLVISFVFANFENTKRVTTVASDTQSSGTMVVTEMEQAIRSAGAGIVADEVTQCASATTYSYYKNVSTSVETSPVPGYSQFFSPVVITNGNVADASLEKRSDTIAIRIGHDVEGSVATRVVPNDSEDPYLLIVERGIGFPKNTVVMLTDGATCAVYEISSIPDSNTPNRMSIAPGTGNTWNPDTAFKTAHGWPKITEKVSVYSPGLLSFRTYSVNSSLQLQVLNQAASAADSTDLLANDVVALQAQYGVSAAPSTPTIANWVEPTGEWAATALDSTHVKRIVAVRIAIVLRNPKKETRDVTDTCSNNAGTNYGPCAWDDTATDKAPLIDLRADPDWKRYRYRTYQTIIPLRNLIWTGL